MGDWVELIISDLGQGMSQDVKERIFEPFFTTKKVGEGTGMGMSVIHGIIKSYDGHIIVDSDLGKGTSIHLLFKPMNNNLVTLEESDDIQNINGTGQHILIIDDQNELADIESNLLSSHGYKCTKRYNSQEALELFLSSESDFDLILTDQTMPNLTGLDLVKMIRSQGISTPVIIVTGYSDKIKDAKVDFENVSILNKPVASRELFAHVAKVLGL